MKINAELSFRNVEVPAMGIKTESVNVKYSFDGQPAEIGETLGLMKQVPAMIREMTMQVIQGEKEINEALEADRADAIANALKEVKGA